MDKRWMAGYAAVLVVLGTACFWGELGDGYSDEDYEYSDDYDYSYDDETYSYGIDHTDEPPDYSGGDNYHGREAVRQALTAAAPEVDNDGYVAEDDYDYWGGCEVHAECQQGEVCASDPACPDYLYCYPKEEAACDCADRFNTVCYFGDCVMRGVDCDGGCPSGTACDQNTGACICNDADCGVTTASDGEPEEPTIEAPDDDGEKCLDDSDCAEGSCINGACGHVPCWSDADCMLEESCELATDGHEYCVAR